MCLKWHARKLSAEALHPGKCTRAPGSLSSDCPVSVVGREENSEGELVVTDKKNKRVAKAKSTQKRKSSMRDPWISPPDSFYTDCYFSTSVRNQKKTGSWNHHNGQEPNNMSMSYSMNTQLWALHKIWTMCILIRATPTSINRSKGDMHLDHVYYLSRSPKTSHVYQPP